MNLLRLPLLAVFLFTSPLFATKPNAAQNIRDLIHQEKVELQDIFEDHQDLFPVLMPDYAIKNNFDETKKSFTVHFKDSFKNYPHPDFFKATSINSKYLQVNNPTQRISGSMKYVGVFSAKYTYDVTNSKDVFIHQVRVHFKNPLGTDIADFSQKVKTAEKIWNETFAKNAFAQQFGIDFAYQFEFSVVTDPKLAHFSVDVADKTRGPYYKEWARNWTAIAIAHEIGHMLGLGDEYQTLSGEDDCLDQSLMCQSWTGELMYHNYYHVLKRLF